MQAHLARDAFADELRWHVRHLRGQRDGRQTAEPASDTRLFFSCKGKGTRDSSESSTHFRKMNAPRRMHPQAEGSQSHRKTSRLQSHLSALGIASTGRVALRSGWRTVPYICVSMRDCTSMIRERPKSATRALKPCGCEVSEHSMMLPPLRSASNRGYLQSILSGLY